MKSYTESLHNSTVPTFAQLASLPVPDGYQCSELYYWYQPWVRVNPAAAPSPPAGEPGTCDISEDSDPILRMAGSSTTDSRGLSQADNQSLLGYFWNPSTDHISTAKGSDLNFHPARRGLRPEWARISETENLL